MKKIKGYRLGVIACSTLLLSACAIPALVEKKMDKTVPETYANSTDTTNMASLKRSIFFEDQYLSALIDTALAHNQELNIILQEIAISQNEIQARKGEYLPSVNLRAGAGVDKVGRYTSQGANDANTDIAPGLETPDPLQDYRVGAFASWEVDIWHKLRNAKKSAAARYLSSIEGRNFMITNVVAEIADSYYELLALDNQLSLVREYIDIQKNALRIVRIQKQAGEVTELAVKKFEAEVLSTQALQYDILQRIRETENRINFLLGRYPQPIQRDSQSFEMPVSDAIEAGIPSQLMENRTDIRQMEYELEAANLDVKVAKARFYPSFDISAGVGFQAFNPSYFIQSPESIIYSLAGDLAAPLINRKAIKADYMNANARQIQVIYDYQRTILNAYIEVANQVSKTSNLAASYDLKAQEVAVLNQSIVIANGLFTSAKADYIEVLTTQRDALDARLELIEYKQQQLITRVNLYRALGGGWR